MDLLKLHSKCKRHIMGRIFLWILSYFYRLAVFIHRHAYEMGFLKVLSVNTRVICFGNLTTGGTGKTTAVILAAKILSQSNLRVAIVSRGYKRQTKKEEVVILDDKTTMSWNKAGDEPYMMFQALREFNVPIIVCPDRYKAAKTAVKKFKSQIILLDDGFQHYALDRENDIVLIDARDPFGGNALLPLGTLREPKSALRRAGLILLTHCNQTENKEINDIKEQIKTYNNDVKIIESIHQPEYYFDICKLEKVPLENITGRAAALSAVGDPQSFENTLKNLYLELEQIWRYPDHHPYTVEELASINELRNNLPLITTYKDFTRFPEGWRSIIKGKVYVLSIHLSILGAEEELQIWTNALYPSAVVHSQLNMRA